MRDDSCIGIDVHYGGRRSDGFALAQSRHSRVELSIQVGFVKRVAINKDEPTDANTGEKFRRGASGTAHAHDGNCTCEEAALLFVA